MPQRILFVDDETNMLEGLRRSLRMCSDEWEVVFATNGHEALQLLGRTPCAVVVTDIMMPVCDGLEVIMALRQRFPGGKIVAMPEGDRKGRFNFLEVAKRLGAHGVLPKPFSSQALIETVRGVLVGQEVAAPPGTAQDEAPSET